jgi:TDG/mug DNA glycosylase family protein
MRTVHSFEPIADARAVVLVLGSMPGERSLQAGQYYAHPQNAFWKILGALIGAGPDLPYAARCAQLRRRRIAVWDVLQSCLRRGSLDAGIASASIVANDFAAFFAGHPGIRSVLCNGDKAHSCYRRHVLPVLAPQYAGLPLRRLPSTSPAHAAMPWPQKLAAWRTGLAGCLGAPPGFSTAR